MQTAEAKAKFLDLISQGWQINDAITAVGRKYETYKSWCKDDLEFKAAKDKARDAVAETEETGRLPVPDFPEFCAELGMPMFPHQRRYWDVLHGAEPEQHPLMKFRRGTEWDPSKADIPGGRMIFNGPPGFAKSTTFTVLWVLWLIHRDPNVRIILVSKTKDSAVKQLGRIKWYLTSSVNRSVISKYAPRQPDGTVGWKDPDQSWSQSQIFVMGKGDGEKDPTVEALGMGGQIFGARADLIILDDVVTLSNVNEYEKQMTWLDQEVESRLDGRGMLLLINTRVSPVDLFSQLRDVTDADDNYVYTYFSQPALLDEGDGTPETWVSLWPEGFPAKRLRKMRRDESRWALVYQQQDVAEDATFDPKAVQASINSARFPGPMSAGAMGHRAEGMDGLYVVGGLDPAAGGYTAMVICGLDRKTGKRFILDGFNQKATSVETLKSTMRRFTEQYRVNEWVVETNAAQKFLIQDAQLKAFLQGRGVKITPHNTNREKHDTDFGVMSMAQLFLTCGEPAKAGQGGPWRKTPETALIELPSPRQNAWVSELVNQLVVWQPTGMGQLTKTDLVMALWFTHLACDKLLNRGRDRAGHMHNPFLSKERARTRSVINIADYRAALEAEKETA